jgi:hypothetical protein
MQSSVSLAEGLPLSSLIPARTDRALLVGQTGSGKTTLAQYLLTQRRYKVVADYKGKINWPGYAVYTKLAQLVGAKEDALLYRPGYGESIDEDVCGRFWEWIYQRGNTTIYVDETAAITKGNVYPFYYGGVLMRGRELGIELWSATQRPKDIPQVVLSESEHVYAFRLRLPQDRERVEQLTGIDRQRIADLRKRAFLYARQDDEIMGPLQLQL